jgi:hypothetical protein
MILLQPIVEVRVATVRDLLAKGLVDRTQVRVMSIRRHPLWCVTNDSNGLREKALGGIHIPLLARAASQLGCHLDQWHSKDSTMFP